MTSALVEGEPCRVRLAVDTAHDVRHAAVRLELEGFGFALYLLVSVKSYHKGKLVVLH